jgi:hypothetical protein
MKHLLFFISVDYFTVKLAIGIRKTASKPQVRGQHLIIIGSVCFVIFVFSEHRRLRRLKCRQICPSNRPSCFQVAFERKICHIPSILSTSIQSCLQSYFNHAGLSYPMTLSNVFFLVCGRKDVLASTLLTCKKNLLIL